MDKVNFLLILTLRIKLGIKTEQDWTYRRTVPVVILLQLFVIYILPYLADGPLWNIRIQPTAEMCKATWWTDLLAINNIVNSKPQVRLATNH